MWAQTETQSVIARGRIASLGGSSSKSESLDPVSLGSLRREAWQASMVRISIPQRVSPFWSPLLRHFPLRKHALSPGWAWKFPRICGLFARNLDGTGAEWSGFFSPNRGILSKA